MWLVRKVEVEDESAWFSLVKNAVGVVAETYPTETVEVLVEGA